MPKPDSLLSAVVVSGGKQYRVAPGDQILVDRIEAEPGSSLTLSRVLLLNDGGEIKVGTPAIAGLEVEARVIAQRRGPRLESLRYKSKKRVRVHHGGRADLTAISIIAIGGKSGKPSETAEEQAPAAKARSSRAKAEAKPAAPASADIKASKAASEAPAKRAPRKPKKETE